MTYLTRTFKAAVVLGIAWFIGLAVAVAAAVVGHVVLVLRYGDDLNRIEHTLQMLAAAWASYLVGIVSGVVALVVGWRHLVMGRSPGVSRRLVYSLGWSLVGWVAADIAGNVLYGSANALVYVIAVGFGVVAYVMLLLRDRRRAVAQNRSTMLERVTLHNAD